MLTLRMPGSETPPDNRRLFVDPNEIATVRPSGESFSWIALKGIEKDVSVEENASDIMAMRACWRSRNAMFPDFPHDSFIPLFVMIQPGGTFGMQAMPKAGQMKPMLGDQAPDLMRHIFSDDAEQEHAEVALEAVFEGTGAEDAGC